MEFETHPSNASSPYAYVTAPTSPSDFNTAKFYCSAPVSPCRKPSNPVAVCGDDHRVISSLGGFEFETSKNFSGQLEWHPSDDHFDHDEGQDGKMAFADELFLNGLVMPLKLPPRLQYDSDSFSLKSQTSSPKATGKKNPFTRKGSWNDDFDPFMVALQKVREDKRGRSIQRSRSYSPFRAMVARCSSECNYYDDHGFSEENSPVERKHAKGPSFSGPLLDFKGSAYTRWVRDQKPSTKSPRRLLLGERVRPLRNDQEGLEKQARPKEKHVVKKCGNAEESKVQKLKGFLLKYVLFGRGSKQAKNRLENNKPNKQYNRLGFKSKENPQGKMGAC